MRDLDADFFVCLFFSRLKNIILAPVSRVEIVVKHTGDFQAFEVMAC